MMKSSSINWLKGVILVSFSIIYRAWEVTFYHELTISFVSIPCF